MLLTRRLPFILGARWTVSFRVVGALLVFTGCTDQSSETTSDLDAELAPALAAAGVEALSPPAPDRQDLVGLGRVLFFDKILSGNKNIACSTCHHLAYHSTDLLSLGIGAGGIRNGPARRLGAGRLLNRNTADLYNRGLSSVSSLFHDGRVELVQGALRTPAGAELPTGIPSVLAAQAMFPVTAREEMRGHPGDTTRFGESNELAAPEDQAYQAIWTALINRILSYPEYLALFRAVFPGHDSTAFGFHHAAIAIAAFERSVFTQLGSPFDRYVAGDPAALSDSAKRGALLFYGRARCGSCHAGPLLTDQAFHNIGIPQLGPGVGTDAPLDFGRGGVTGRHEDRFAFRTPSLRNVLLTGPWMHNGAYPILDNAIRHYRDPRLALLSYDPGQLDPRVAPLIQRDQATVAAVLATLDTSLRVPTVLTDQDIALIRVFLRSLTDPAALIQLEEIPDRVPSGLSPFE